VVCGGASKQTTNKKDFYRLQEQDAWIQVELNDDASYPMTEMGSVSFCMPSGDVLELYN
jgi:hypothetical protein